MVMLYEGSHTRQYWWRCGSKAASNFPPTAKHSTTTKSAISPSLCPAALVPLPQGWAGHVDPGIKSSIVAFSMAVGVCLAILWRYVFARYAGAPAETWRHAAIKA